MHFFLGIDLGTSYFKAGLFDENGRLCGLGRQLVKKNEFGDHLCELPVAVFWSTLRIAIAQALSEAGSSASAVRAVSYSSQANSFLFLDGKDQPLTPLILWPDERVRTLSPALESFAEKERWRERTGIGLPPGPEYFINKLWWFQKKRPLLWKEVVSVQTISDYLTFTLTGYQAGDLSTASLSGLVDAQEAGWWKEAVDLTQLPPHALSALHRTGTRVGPVTRRGADSLGLKAGIPFFLGGLDHHIAAMGAGLQPDKDMSESTGTVLAVVQYTGQYQPQENIYLAPGPEAHRFFRMRFDRNGAGFLEWYRKEQAPEWSIPELINLAAEVPAGSEGLVAKPGRQAGKNEYGFAKGQPFHQHGHFVRAILESTAWSLGKLIAGMDGKAAAGKIISTGGGARSRLWTQIKADITGRTFILPECSEAACLGAALLAAAGTGVFLNIEEGMRHWVRKKEEILPNPPSREQYKTWAQEKMNCIP